MSVDPYQVLGLGRNATQEEIKRAYKKKALLYHPDKATTPEERVIANREMRLINVAYEMLEKGEFTSSSPAEEGSNLDEEVSRSTQISKYQTVEGGQVEETVTTILFENGKKKRIEKRVVIDKDGQKSETVKTTVNFNVNLDSGCSVM